MLNFHWPKNQSSSTSCGFARTGFQTTCKITKNWPKNRFFLKNFWRTKKSLVLKWPKKNSLQDSLNTLKPIFDFWNFLFQIVICNFTSWGSQQVKVRILHVNPDFLWKVEIQTKKFNEKKYLFSTYDISYFKSLKFWLSLQTGNFISIPAYVRCQAALVRLLINTRFSK